jgi:hypothetical protein
MRLPPRPLTAATDAFSGPRTRLGWPSSTSRNTLDHVRFEWTSDGYERVVSQGLDPAEVNEALVGSGPKLLEPVGDDMLSVVVRINRGRLIEVWLREDLDDGEREIFAAFDAGFIARAKWTTAFGREE